MGRIGIWTKNRLEAWTKPGIGIRNKRRNRRTAGTCISIRQKCLPPDRRGKASYPCIPTRWKRLFAPLIPARRKRPFTPLVPARQMRLFAPLVPVLLLLTLLSGCGAPKSVVVYTAVDQVYSEPLFRQFTQETGITVLPVYDVEAAKTTGLINRLMAEKARPQADVFWSNEFIQTILLQKNGILAPYLSASAKDIPAVFKEERGYWTGFGGRARVLIVNTDLVAKSQYPASLLGLLDSGIALDQIGIAMPMFGTTATHTAALYAQLGRDKALAWYRTLQGNGVQVVDGNSVVRDLVVTGALAMGLTDTDDAYGAVNEGAPVDVVYLDQGEGDMGTLINPNTAALIAGSPHPARAKQFIDWLLKPSTEAALLAAGFIDLPCRDVGVKSKNLGNRAVKGMSVNLADIYANLEVSRTDMTELFIK